MRARRRGQEDRAGATAAAFGESVAAGTRLRHDHGSRFVSFDFQAEITYLGLASPLAFVCEPEGNGCAERLIRVLKENLLWQRRFDTVDDLRHALHEFEDADEESWILQRHGYRTPARVRTGQTAFAVAARGKRRVSKLWTAIATWHPPGHKALSPQGLSTRDRDRMPLILSWPCPPHANQVIDALTSALNDPDDVVEDFDSRRWRPAAAPISRLIIHWPDKIFWNNPPFYKLFLRIARVLFQVIIIKKRGGSVIWFIHNLQPHDIRSTQKPLWKIYADLLARMTNGWLTLAPSTGAEVIQAFPSLKRRPHSFIWHPAYHWSAPITRQQARERLKYKEDETIFAHIGFLRPYKGITEFAEQFASTDIRDTRLLIAGNPSSSEFGDEIAKLAVVHDRIDVMQKYLDTQTYNTYLEAVDVFVAPYRNFLHSGALVHALCRRCVVIAPNSLFTKDLAAVVGPEWIVAFDQSPTKDDIEAACARVRSLQSRQPDLSALAPEENIDRIREFLAQVDETSRQGE